MICLGDFSSATEISLIVNNPSGRNFHTVVISRLEQSEFYL